jgi:hypothetical protein
VWRSETLALKRLYQLQKLGNFWILISGLNLNISGALEYNVLLGLFSKKKGRLEMKSETQFLRKKRWILPVFEFFARNEISLGIGGIMGLTQIYLITFKVYIKSV